MNSFLFVLWKFTNIGNWDGNWWRMLRFCCVVISVGFYWTASIQIHYIWMHCMSTVTCIANDDFSTVIYLLHCHETPSWVHSNFSEVEKAFRFLPLSHFQIARRYERHYTSWFCLWVSQTQWFSFLYTQKAL